VRTAGALQFTAIPGNTWPVKEHLRELVAQSLLDLRRHGKLPQDLAVPDYTIGRTKSRGNGD